MKSLPALLIALGLTAACTEAAAPTEEPPVVETPPGPEVGTLAWAVAGDWRSEAEKARDAWRNPEETLAFFEVAADETVIEIWPGGGWYTNILAPYLNAGGGQFIAASWDPDAFEGERQERILQRIADYQAVYAANPDLFGEIELTAFSNLTGPLTPEESVDTVLTFRNVHNWMGGDYTAKFFTDAYAALKPGGVLGVVEHRLPSSAVQDPRGTSGYVHEDYVKALAAAAGFEFAGASEVNANPADTADHPYGVWTLPPVSRTEARDGIVAEGFDPAPYLEIGESDRMTLKFVKPVPEAGLESVE